MKMMLTTVEKVQKLFTLSKEVLIMFKQMKKLFCKSKDVQNKEKSKEFLKGQEFAKSLSEEPKEILLNSDVPRKKYPAFKRVEEMSTDSWSE